MRWMSGNPVGWACDGSPRSIYLISRRRSSGPRLEHMELVC